MNGSGPSLMGPRVVVKVGGAGVASLLGAGIASASPGVPPSSRLASLASLVSLASPGPVGELTSLGPPPHAPAARSTTPRARWIDGDTDRMPDAREHEAFPRARPPEQAKDSGAVAIGRGRLVAARARARMSYRAADHQGQL